METAKEDIIYYEQPDVATCCGFCGLSFSHKHNKGTLPKHYVHMPGKLCTRGPRQEGEKKCSCPCGIVFHVSDEQEPKPCKLHSEGVTSNPEEYITTYDMRGPWASAEDKDDIRKQINEKVASLFTSETVLKGERRRIIEQIRREEMENIKELLPKKNSYGDISGEKYEWERGFNNCLERVHLIIQKNV